LEVEREDAQGANRGLGSARKQDRRRLPPELTGLLPRKLEHGLDHVTRRRILRVMHEGQREVSSAQLSRDGEPLADLSLSVVAYHMNVLAKYGMVRLTRTQPTRGVVEHFYASEVEGDAVILSILEQTEGLDASRREQRP
jgi:DNA-binding transcriptional ArsR family regulator